METIYVMFGKAKLENSFHQANICQCRPCACVCVTVTHNLSISCHSHLLGNVRKKQLIGYNFKRRFHLLANWDISQMLKTFSKWNQDWEDTNLGVLQCVICFGSSANRRCSIPPNSPLVGSLAIILPTASAVGLKRASSCAQIACMRSKSLTDFEYAN